MASLKTLKPILVTGGAKRIGHAIVQRFASLGHPVVIHASPRTAEVADEETQKLVGLGYKARYLIADLYCGNDCATHKSSVRILWAIRNISE